MAGSCGRSFDSSLRQMLNFSILLMKNDFKDAAPVRRKRFMDFMGGKRNRNRIHTLRSAVGTYARRGAAAVLALLLTVSGFPARAFAPGTAAGQIFAAGQVYAAERLVKAVTYMGSEWTVNFWDSELRTM